MRPEIEAWRRRVEERLVEMGVDVESATFRQPPSKEHAVLRAVSRRAYCLGWGIERDEDGEKFILVLFDRYSDLLWIDYSLSVPGYPPSPSPPWWCYAKTTRGGDIPWFIEASSTFEEEVSMTTSEAEAIEWVEALVRMFLALPK